jgi:hypothetical protein
MIESVTDICRQCDHLKPIQNKTKWICGDCVFENNHGGKTRQEVYKERHDKRAAKKRDPLPDVFPVNKDLLIAGLKKVFSIKQVSNKRAQRLREAICSGCGRGNIPLSHSHILSERIRPDLYSNVDNIQLHCFGNYKSCHETWERGIIEEVVEMDDFAQNLSFIKEVDQEKYNAIVAKAEFRGIKLPQV